MAGQPLRPTEHSEEATLVRLAAAGDSEAFVVLYRSHMAAIYRYIYLRVRQVAEAEELTEETFLRAWQALPGYEIREVGFAAWLYRIAHNLVIDHGRKDRLPVVDSADTEWPDEASPSVEQYLQAGETRDALHRAIGQLNSNEQQVIVLRFIEGLSHQQVAVIMGKSPEACRVLQHRALIRLNAILQAAGYDAN
ncbi:MAG: sigma-70 family RNA polymerase sigma factor [Anaerolineae bacterium]|nr:sigma-70 family RNA polymerase sigma factor [Anaerolineae bacterium]